MRSVTLSNETLLPEVGKLLSEGSKVTIRARGNSMLPFIRGEKDSVILKSEEDYSVGDIVLAEISPKMFVLHRITKKNDNVITLMGDGNPAKTERCLQDNIHGRVIAVVKNGREIDCNNKISQLQAKVWKQLLPLRKYLLAIYRRIT